VRINVAVPEAHVDAPVLDAALEAVTRLNESLLHKNEIPSFEKGLTYGVKWRPEPPGAEHFDHGRTVVQRKWGDCDDLAPWHAASLRHSGEDPGAAAVVKRSGPHTWHAVVQRSDGSIDDPSKRAGMGQPHGIIGASLPVMWAPPPGGAVSGAYIIRPQLALRPVRGGVQARADMPWHWREHLEDEPTPTDYAMTTLHTAPVASTALTGVLEAAAEAIVGACEGACELGNAAGYAHPDHIDRLCAIADACEGADFEELESTYGPEHARAAQQVVGSFFGSIAKGMGHAFHTALPIASNLVDFIPGVPPGAGKTLARAAALFPPGHPHHEAAMRAAAREVSPHAQHGPGFTLKFHAIPFE